MRDDTSITVAVAGQFDWNLVEQIIEPELGALMQSAHEGGALIRCRRVKSASVLLRLILAYACGDASLQRVGSWAARQELCDLSAVAISLRLRTAVRWLGCLVARFMVRRRLSLPQPDGGVRVRIIDATTASRPGSKGTDWRVHVSLDLGTMCVDEVELTDAHGGETLVRHITGPGEIILADCGYAHRRGLGSALANGAHVVVRMNWHNLPLRDPTGNKIDVSAWLTEIGSTDIAERPALVETPEGTYPVRLVVGRLSSKAAQAARKRSCHQSRKKKHKIDPRTLHAAGFCILLASLPAEVWHSSHVLELYRIRWQIEMHFKRMKSILHLGDIPAHHPDVVQSYLLAQLILALIVEELIMLSGTCGLDGMLPESSPPSLWRLTVTCWESLKNAIRGAPALQPLQLVLP
ncbi:MAG: transposase, partial [Chloroflexota bacterium]|nr:transposase [Chloroflexota bacterium]